MSSWDQLASEGCFSAINGLLSAAGHLSTKVQPAQTHLHMEEKWQTVFSGERSKSSCITRMCQKLEAGSSLLEKSGTTLTKRETTSYNFDITLNDWRFKWVFQSKTSRVNINRFEWARSTPSKHYTPLIQPWVTGPQTPTHPHTYTHYRKNTYCCCYCTACTYGWHAQTQGGEFTQPSNT